MSSRPRILRLSVLFVAACDPGAGGGYDLHAINAMVATVKAESAKASTDSDRDRMVLDVAASDLACPRGSVGIAMVFDRRFGNSYSLRYLVEGCGTRALYGEDCTHMDACRYVLASRTSLDGLEPALPTPIPARPPSALLPPELRGLSVHLEPHIVGVLVAGETPEHALATCKKGDAELVREMGWLVAEDGAVPDLLARFGCTGHVEFVPHGQHLEIVVPRDGTPSLQLLAGERVVATVPAGASRFSCDSEAADPEADCGRRASAMAGARIAAGLAKSSELKAFAAEHARRP